jgi:hypothetical protein
VTAQNDKLDLSDLLTDSTYTPGLSAIDNFVKFDNSTGQVFVDKTGAGAFDSSKLVATLNNVSGFDTINVVLNDTEGSKTIHTV